MWGRLQHWPFRKPFGLWTFVQLFFCKHWSCCVGTPLPCSAVMVLHGGISYWLCEALLRVAVRLPPVHRLPPSPLIHNPGTRGKFSKLPSPVETEGKHTGPVCSVTNMHRASGRWGELLGCKKEGYSPRTFVSLTPTHLLMCIRTKLWSHACGYPASSWITPPTK